MNSHFKTGCSFALQNNTDDSIDHADNRFTVQQFDDKSVQNDDDKNQADNRFTVEQFEEPKTQNRLQLRPQNAQHSQTPKTQADDPKIPSHLNFKMMNYRQMLEIGKIFIKNGIHYCQVQYKDKKREEILTYIDMQIMRPDLLFKYFDKACPSKPL